MIPCLHPKDRETRNALPTSPALPSQSSVTLGSILEALPALSDINHEYHLPIRLLLCTRNREAPSALATQYRKPIPLRLSQATSPPAKPRPTAKNSMIQSPGSAKPALWTVCTQVHTEAYSTRVANSKLKCQDTYQRPESPSAMLPFYDAAPSIL